MKLTIMAIGLLCSIPVLCQDTVKKEIPADAFQRIKANHTARKTNTAFPYSEQSNDVTTTERKRMPEYDYSMGYVTGFIKAKGLLGNGHKLTVDQYNRTRQFYSYQQTETGPNDAFTTTVHWWRFYPFTNELVDAITKKRLN
jgi:hypothetical protein